MRSARPSSMRANAVLALLALLVAALLLFHLAIPDVGGWAGLIESFLPWCGVLIALLAIVAVVRRSAFAVLGAVVAAIVWLMVFVPVLATHPGSGTADLTVISENIDADNRDPARTVDELAARKPDVIALQELTPSSRATAGAHLARAYPHHYVVGTVGVWSVYPLSHAEPLALGLDWKRALRVDVKTDAGSVRLYELHAASLRPGEFAERNQMLGRLRQALATDHATRLIAVGDFNAASTDRSFTQLLSKQTGTTEAPTTSLGFGFTWPAKFPVARLDHLLTRGLSVVSSTVLPADGSDHRAIEVALR